MNWMLSFSLLGLCLSSYAVYVEYKHSIDSNFEAMCDLSSTVSCSKVFTSPQGKIWSYWGLIEKDSMLDQPNALYGMGYYAAILILSQHKLFNKSLFWSTILLLLSAGSLALSGYLAYVLMYELRDFCVVCTGSYVCNTAILGLAYSQRKELHKNKDV